MAATLFSTGISVGATGSGAIVGANETPYAAVILDGFSPFQGTLTTGDLGTAGFPGEGDYTGAGAFAVELWLKIDNVNGSAGGTVVAGPQVGLGGGAGQLQWAIYTGVGGSLGVSVLDENAFAHGSSVAGALQSNVWTHVVFNVVGLGGADLYVNGVRRVNDATWGNHSVYGTTNAPLNGRSLQLGGPPASSGVQWYFDELALYNEALDPTRITAHYTAGVARGFEIKKVGARLVDVLNAVSSHAPQDFQTGLRNVIPRYMTGQSPLEECRRALEADDVDAVFFTKADGTLKFLQANHRTAPPYNISQATFGDAGTELPYMDYQADYSASFLVNQWSVTRTAFGASTAVTQTASDATSISQNFPHSETISDVPVTNDTDAAAIATALLAKTKDSLKRVTSIQPKMADANTALAVYRRELMDKITVKRRPPGGGAPISQDLFIQQITHEGVPGRPPTCSLGVSPL